MKLINNQTKLNNYIKKYNIKDFFGIDMKKYMKLHSFDSCIRKTCRRFV